MKICWKLRREKCAIVCVNFLNMNSLKKLFELVNRNIKYDATYELIRILINFSKWAELSTILLTCTTVHLAYSTISSLVIIYFTFFNSGNTNYDIFVAVKLLLCGRSVQWSAGKKSASEVKRWKHFVCSCCLVQWLVSFMPPQLWNSTVPKLIEYNSFLSFKNLMA